MFRAFFFRRPATLESAATRSLPRGGGLGRGHSPNFGNLSEHLTAPIQALRLAALSLTLSHGREDGVAVRVKGSARKQVVQAALCCSDDLLNAYFRQPARHNLQKTNQKPLPSCRLLFIPAAALRHYTPNAAGSGRLKRVYTSKSLLR